MTLALSLNIVLQCVQNMSMWFWVYFFLDSSSPVVNAWHSEWISSQVLISLYAVNLILCYFCKNWHIYSMYVKFENWHVNILNCWKKLNLATTLQNTTEEETGHANCTSLCICRILSMWNVNSMVKSGKFADFVLFSCGFVLYYRVIKNYLTHFSLDLFCMSFDLWCWFFLKKIFIEIELTLSLNIITTTATTILWTRVNLH